METPKLGVLELCFYSYALTLSTVLILLGTPLGQASAIAFLAWVLLHQRPGVEK